MGISCNGPDYIEVDNKYVLANNPPPPPKVKSLGWCSTAEMVDTLLITSFGVRISVNFCLVKTHSVSINKTFYPPYILLLEPRHIPHLVRASIVLIGGFSLCVWH